MNHENWKPIGEPEFNGFLEQQIGELDEAERTAFEAFRVSPWKARIRRTEKAGDEWVYVVLQKQAGVLYFDDVEYGFNIAGVDEHGGILNPGGSQFSLKEAIRFWMLV